MQAAVLHRTIIIAAVRVGVMADNQLQACYFQKMNQQRGRRQMVRVLLKTSRAGTAREPGSSINGCEMMKARNAEMHTWLWFI